MQAPSWLAEPCHPLWAQHALRTAQQLQTTNHRFTTPLVSWIWTNSESGLQPSGRSTSRGYSGHQSLVVAVAGHRQHTRSQEANRRVLGSSRSLRAVTTPTMTSGGWRWTTFCAVRCMHSLHEVESQCLCTTKNMRSVCIGCQSPLAAMPGPRLQASRGAQSGSKKQGTLPATVARHHAVGTQITHGFQQRSNAAANRRVQSSFTLQDACQSSCWQ